MALLRIALAGLLVGVLCTAVQAQSFRVETKVYLNDERESALETLTLFDNGRPYDFILDGRQQLVETTPSSCCSLPAASCNRK